MRFHSTRQRVEPGSPVLRTRFMSLSRGRGDPKLMNLVQRTNQVPSAADVLEKPVMSVHIVYETHSTSLDNERGIATGWLGGELSAQGREQARELGQRRRHDSIDVVFASDLNRAVETAQIAFAETGLPVRLDWRLRECNYGSMNGMPRSRLDTERGLRLDEPFPEGKAGDRRSRESEASSTSFPRRTRAGVSW